MELLEAGVELLKEVDRLPTNHWSALHAYCSVELKQFARAVKETQDCLAVEKVAEDLGKA